MKRIIISSMLLLSLLLMPSIVCAEEFNGGLHINIPSSCHQKVLDKEGVIYHGNINSEKLELGIYTWRTLQTNIASNWKSKTSNELKQIATDTISSQKKKNDTHITNYKLMDTKQMKFLVFDGTVTNDEKHKKYFTQFTTIINGGTLQLTFYSDSPCTSEQKRIASTIVSTAYYDKVKEQSIDKKFILEISTIFIVIILLILSVIFNVRRYRRKLKLKETNNEFNNQ